MLTSSSPATAHGSNGHVSTLPEARRIRRRAQVLFGVTCIWLLLPFLNHLSSEAALGPREVLVLGLAVLSIVLLPLFAFVALILLTRRAVQLSGIQGPERSRLAWLCLFLGPLGCLLTVLDVTTPRIAA